MESKRVTTGLLAFPFVVIILMLGNKYIVDVAFAIVAAISLHEYFNAFKAKAKPIIWLGYIASLLIAFIHFIPVTYALNVIAIIIPVTIALLFLQVVLTNMKYTINDIAITFFGICYIPLFLMFIPLIYGMEYGNILVWYILFSAWGTDIFAYVIGRLWGKHKFSKVSPNKSIEGCVGGVIGSIILNLGYTVICNMCFGLDMSYTYILLFAIVLSVIGQIGDFAASSIKRYVSIKDFSNLIPGHGGMLDRIDSVIFIAPFAYILLMLVK